MCLECMMWEEGVMFVEGEMYKRFVMCEKDVIRLEGLT